MLMLGSFLKKSSFGANGQLRGFEIALKGRVIPPVWGGEWEILRGFFLLGGGNLTRSDFNHLNFFQSLKQHSVHIDHQLKSKLM